MDRPIAFSITFEIGPNLAPLFKRDHEQLDRIEGKVDKIMLTQQETTDLLNKIDATTNATADNVSTIAQVDQQISDEIDAFLKANPAGTTLTDAQVAQLQSLADRAQKTSDASTAQVSVLKAIAAKGAPVTPPPPPPPPPIGG